MKSKTVILPKGEYKVENGALYVWEIKRGPFEDYPDYSNPSAWGWVETAYKIGSCAILVERDNIAKRDEKPSYFLSFSTDGIGGNMDRNIKRYHGWRGTSNDVAIHSYGIRKIQSIKVCRNGIPHVKVGCDLHPDWS